MDEKDIIICPKCGKKIEKESGNTNNFCPNCGEKIESLDANEDKNFFVTHWKTILWIIGWIVCFPIPVSILIARSKWTKKSLLIGIDFFWGLFIVIWAIIICFISWHSNSTTDSYIKMPMSSYSFTQKSCDTAVSILKTAGYTNINTEKVETFLKRLDGDVEEIEVAGDSNFSKNEKVLKDAPIVVYYYVYSEQMAVQMTTTSNAVTTVSTTTVTTTTTSTSTSVVTSSTTTTTETTTSTSKQVMTTTMPVTTEIITKRDDSEVLTPDNCSDLANLLSAADDFDLYRSFVEKNKGKTIEFDAYVAKITHHEKYKTRYDILVYAGDALNGARGPAFQFRNVNMNELNLIGAENMDYLSENQNIRIKAKVEEYTKGDLLILDPVSTTIR